MNRYKELDDGSPTTRAYRIGYALGGLLFVLIVIGAIGLIVWGGTR